MDLAGNRPRNNGLVPIFNNNNNDIDNDGDDDNDPAFVDIDDGNNDNDNDRAFMEYGQHLEENYIGQKTRDQYAARVRTIAVFMSERIDFREQFLELQADGSYRLASALSEQALTCFFGKVCSTPTAQSIVPSYSTVNGFASALKNYYQSSNIIMTKPVKELLKKILVSGTRSGTYPVVLCSSSLSLSDSLSVQSISACLKSINNDPCIIE